MIATLVKTPGVTGAPGHYPANRPPLLPSALTALPPGAVKAHDWLGHQLTLMLDGITGRLPEYGAFFRPERNGWLHGETGQGWEEVPYWLRGFAPLAILTGDERCLNLLKRYVDALKASQNEDGYFGPPPLKLMEGKNGQRVCDLWPHMLVLSALEDYYEYTGDGSILDMMGRFYRFCLSLPDDSFIPPDTRGNLGWGGEAFGSMRPFIQYVRAGDLIPRLLWYYNHTGDEDALTLTHRVHARIRPPWDEWLDHHVVNFAQRFAYDGQYYPLSGERHHLDSVEYWYRQHMLTWGQMPGGIFAADERIRPGCVDPRQAFEPCGIVEFTKNFYDLARITGDSLYGDRAEEIILNHFPAGMTPELKGIHYLIAANQPQLDRCGDHPNRNTGPMYIFTARNRCCGHNSGIGWPYYVRNMWQATADGGLAALLYGPCIVTARAGREGREVRIRQDTRYPFGGEMEFTVECDGPVAFPLYLRIPGWCMKAELQINGRTLCLQIKPLHYIRIERRWQPGDRIALSLDMPVMTERWPRNGSVSIRRGPLYYSLKIAEQWRKCNDVDYEPYRTDEAWPNWEVLPRSPWNYGLVLEDNELQVDGIRMAEHMDHQPFTPESAPVTIRTRGKRIPAWGLQNNTAAELQPSPIRTQTGEEVIELIPLGCARLRMSCLPVIGDGPGARPWVPVDDIAAGDKPKNRFDELYAKKKVDVGQE